MKYTLLIVLTALLIAAVGAPSATAQRAPCSQKASLRALITPASDLQMYVFERCGRRIGLPFG
jgi:hypothetical protein